MGPPDRAGVVSCDAPKIFNNPVGFEQPLWQLELGQVAYSPKTRVLERSYLLRGRWINEPIGLVSAPVAYS